MQHIMLYNQQLTSLFNIIHITRIANYHPFLRLKWEIVTISTADDRASVSGFAHPWRCCLVQGQINPPLEALYRPLRLILAVPLTLTACFPGHL